MPNIETLAVHVGHQVDPSTGAVAPNIVMSTTFERAPDYSTPHGNVYTRSDNPNRRALESALAALEGGAAAVAFASGQAATAAMLHALNPGEHAILPAELYYNTRGLADGHYARWGLRLSYVDMTDADALERALRPETRLIWVETPSNPRLRVADIARAAEFARGAGALCVVDNTWATPLFQRPLELDADVVMHSTTKYFGGHSDVLGGCLVVKSADTEIYQRIRGYQVQGGAVPSPFDCWLLLRSIPTLPVRVRAQAATAERLAAFLEAHPNVERVHYPGLDSHPQRAIAARQMRGGGPMLSFEVRGGAPAALAAAARTRLFIRATSLGGYESLIEHRASVEAPSAMVPPGLLRCSVGLEHADDLVADLDQALC